MFCGCAVRAKKREGEMEMQLRTENAEDVCLFCGGSLARRRTRLLEKLYCPRCIREGFYLLHTHLGRDNGWRRRAATKGGER